MKTNVSTLLREFPKVRQAALAGEEVIIVTREGDLRLTAVTCSGESILGSRKDRIRFLYDQLDRPTLPENQWNPSL
jgi:hypothetical protein